MQESSRQQSKTLQLEMFKMQQVSNDATKEVSEFVDNTNCQFAQQIFSANGIKATMEDCLMEW